MWCFRLFSSVFQRIFLFYDFFLRCFCRSSSFRSKKGKKDFLFRRFSRKTVDIFSSLYIIYFSLWVLKYGVFWLFYWRNMQVVFPVYLQMAGYNRPFPGGKIKKTKRMFSFRVEEKAELSLIAVTFLTLSPCAKAWACLPKDFSCRTVRANGNFRLTSALTCICMEYLPHYTIWVPRGLWTWLPHRVWRNSSVCPFI